MLINTDTKEFQEWCKLRQSQKAYEAIGETVKSRAAFRILKLNIEMATNGVIDLIDEANKEQG